MAFALAGLVGLAGCEAERPIRIGLLSGLTGHDVPNAEDGRNGAILAVEQRNAAGGVRGRPLELLVQDDGPDEAGAQAAVHRLLASRVVGVIGPFASSAVSATLPSIQAAHVLMLSPTASANQLAAVDDNLIRLSATAGQLGSAYATVLYQRGQRRVALAVAVDTRGATYTHSWRDGFSAAFVALGGEVVAEAGYAHDAGGLLGDVVRGLLAHHPDGLVFAGGTAEVARMVQQARKQAPAVPIAVAEAAANAALIELGGRAVEGVVTAQLFNPADTSARYQQFHTDYVARFGRLPGYHTVMAYNAITVLAGAMELQRDAESLKEAVLRHSPYQGLQQPIVFDRFGDASRELHFSMVQNGRFELLR